MKIKKQLEISIISVRTKYYTDSWVHQRQDVPLAMIASNEFLVVGGQTIVRDDVHSYEPIVDVIDHWKICEKIRRVRIRSTDSE